VGGEDDTFTRRGGGIRDDGLDASVPQAAPDRIREALVVFGQQHAHHGDYTTAG
jgi:hypothetical protein